MYIARLLEGFMDFPRQLKGMLLLLAEMSRATIHLLSLFICKGRSFPYP